MDEIFERYVNDYNALLQRCRSLLDLKNRGVLEPGHRREVYACLVHVCLRARDTEAFRILLQVYPCLASERGVGLALVEVQLISGSKRNWDHFCLSVKCAHYKTVSHRSLHNFPVLHAVFALNRKAALLKFVLSKLARSQAGVRDMKGFLPLHYAITSRYTTKSHLKLLLKYFPPAANSTMPCGNLPLLFALKNGKDIASQVLLKHHPGAVKEQEISTGESALSLAAQNCSVETIFKVLYADPQVLHTR